MNAPDRIEVLTAPEGEKQVVMKLDEKMTNAATFTLKREDHTLGNLLRTQLLRDPQVHFSGYLHPHPLDHDIILKVQTTSHSRPAEAVARSAMQLQGVYAQMLRCMREHVASQAFGGDEGLE